MSSNGGAELAFFLSLIWTGNFINQLTPQLFPVQPQTSTSSSQSKLQSPVKAETSWGIKLVCLFLWLVSRTRVNHFHPSIIITTKILFQSTSCTWSCYSRNLSQQPPGERQECILEMSPVHHRTHATWPGLFYFKLKTCRAGIGDSSHLSI